MSAITVSTTVTFMFYVETVELGCFLVNLWRFSFLLLSIFSSAYYSHLPIASFTDFYRILWLTKCSFRLDHRLEFCNPNWICLVLFICNWIHAVFMFWSDMHAPHFVRKSGFIKWLTFSVFYMPLTWNFTNVPYKYSFVCHSIYNLQWGGIVHPVTFCG